MNMIDALLFIAILACCIAMVWLQIEHNKSKLENAKRVFEQQRKLLDLEMEEAGYQPKDGA